MIVISEKDPIKKDSYCIECFGTKENMYFYNSRGPLCTVVCYCKYVGIEREEVDRVIYRGVLKDKRSN